MAWTSRPRAAATRDWPDAARPAPERVESQASLPLQEVADALVRGRGARGLLVERGLVQVRRPRFAVQTPFSQQGTRLLRMACGHEQAHATDRWSQEGIDPGEAFVSHVDLDSRAPEEAGGHPGFRDPPERSHHYESVLHGDTPASTRARDCYCMGRLGSVKDAGGGSGYSYPAASMASVIMDMIRSSQKAHISALAARAFGGGSPWMCGIQVSSVPFARITRAASRGAIRMVVFICSPCPRGWQGGLTWEQRAGAHRPDGFSTPHPGRGSTTIGGHSGSSRGGACPPSWSVTV